MKSNKKSYIRGSRKTQVEASAPAQADVDACDLDKVAVHLRSIYAILPKGCALTINISETSTDHLKVCPTKITL